MKKWLFHLCLAWISFQASGQTQIQYTVFYEAPLEKNGLKVQLEYVHKKATDSTQLYYRNRIWSESDIYKSLSIRADENRGMRVEADTLNNRIMVHHPKSKRFTFTYRIKQDYTEPDYQTYYRPRIHNEFFHVLGQTLFMVPIEFATTANMNNLLDVQVKWVNFPEGFKIHNTFASQTTDQRMKTPLWDGLYHSLFVGGDYRIYPFRHHEKPVYFAVRGNWLRGISDSFLLDHAQKAIRSQRDFWNDYGQDYFALTISPTVSQNDSLYRGRSVAGTAVTNGFFVQATNNPFNDSEAFVYVLHHELMHHWIGGKIPTRHEELNYWFSEGFTDYYTYKNRLRIKDLSLEQWQILFNREVIQAHWTNPEKNIPNYHIKDGFWESRNVEKVPYRRGSIFAFWLDNQILLKSHYTRSLDDLMRELSVVCSKENKRFDDELFLELSKKYLEDDIAYFFQKHVISGEDIDLVNQKWAEGFMFTMQENVPTLTAAPGTDSKYILP